MKDRRQLDSIYRRAYLQSIRLEGKPWPLAANLLATSNLEKGIADTTILKPLIDEGFGCNQPIRDVFSGKTEIINPDVILANQVVTLLKAGSVSRAVQLSLLLPGKYRTLIDIARCLGGYFRGNTPEDRRIYATVRDSSPQNNVVMNLAMNNIALAREAAKKLPEDDPVAKYLTVQITCRSYSTYNSMPYEVSTAAVSTLAACFRMDKSFISIAQSDWDIFEDLVKDAVYEYENPVEY